MRQKEKKNGAECRMRVSAEYFRDIVMVMAFSSFRTQPQLTRTRSSLNGVHKLYEYEIHPFVYHHRTAFYGRLAMTTANTCTRILSFHTSSKMCAYIIHNIWINMAVMSWIDYAYVICNNIIIYCNAVHQTNNKIQILLIWKLRVGWESNFNFWINVRIVICYTSLSNRLSTY